MAEMNRGRSLGIDHVKAALILLVILGHTYGAGINDDPVKYGIYGFHMPMFLFVSGYLISPERLAREELPQAGRRYWSRMVWQWLVVSLAFELFSGGLRGNSLLDSARLMLTEPRFHLWYIPVLAGAVLMIWVIAPFRRWYLALGALLLVSTIIFASPLRPMLPFDLPFDPRFLSYPFFVWLGMMARLRRLRLPTSPWPLLITAAIGAGVYAIGFDQAGWYRSGGRLVLATALCLLLPALMQRWDQPVRGVSRIAILLSTYSLWVYLLHPFVTEQMLISQTGVISDTAMGIGITAGIGTIAVAFAWAWDRVAVQARRGASSLVADSGR